MTVKVILKLYKGFRIEGQGKLVIVITAIKIHKDKLDEILLKHGDYSLWTDNCVYSHKIPPQESEMIKRVKDEIDRFDQDKTAIIDEIVINISRPKDQAQFETEPLEET